MSIGYALRRAQGAVYADLNDALARISLRPLQYTLLLMVAENPGRQPVRGLRGAGHPESKLRADHERAGTPRPHHPPQVHGDARSYELHITNKGKRILQRAGEVQSSHEQRLIERIGVEGRDQLLRLLGKLTDIK